jgi:uncharacterized protein (TIGR03083 family)
MSEGTKEAIAALRRAHDELAATAGRLGHEALTTKSGSQEWTVAQVLSHLGSSAEISLKTLQAGKADPDDAQPVWDRWNAMSPEEQAANFAASENLLVDALENLSDEELSTKRVDVGFLPAPIDVGFFVGMRSSEVALHGWDVDVAFDQAATVRAYLVPFVLDRLPLFAGFFAKPTGKTEKVSINTKDPSRFYLLELRDNGTSLSEEDGPAVDARTKVEMPGEALVRLTAGRLSPGRTPAGVHAEGELTLDELRSVFPGY